MEMRKAVELAISALRDVSGEDPPNLLFEEVERSKDESTWFVTLGFDRVEFERPDLFQKLGIGDLLAPKSKPVQRTRIYKVVALRDHDGHVLSIKIRKPL